jgi:hypothetical protein
MKATIDLPDDLYRQVKAKSALEGRSIRGVTAELLAAYVNGQALLAQPTPDPAAGEGSSTPPWFGLARKHLRPDVAHDWSQIQAGIERGWAGEVAEPAAPSVPAQRRSARAKKRP